MDAKEVNLSKEFVDKISPGSRQIKTANMRVLKKLLPSLARKGGLANLLSLLI